MFSRRTVVTTVAACLLSFAAFAPAQTEGTKVAVCSPARVFNDMQETKDLRAKIEAQQKDFKGQADAKQQHVKDLQAQRDLLKVDSPQYKAADDAFTEKLLFWKPEKVPGTPVNADAEEKRLSAEKAAGDLDKPRDSATIQGQGDDAKPDDTAKSEHHGWLDGIF